MGFLGWLVGWGLGVGMFGVGMFGVGGGVSWLFIVLSFICSDTLMLFGMTIGSSAVQVGFGWWCFGWEWEWEWEWKGAW